MTPPLLETRGLSRHYRSARGDPRRGLDDVSLTLGAGEILGLVGESGSGKSTLARLVMGLDRPSAGQVLFQGTDIAMLSSRDLAALRRHFQMVFQDPYGSLDPRQRVERIVAEPLHCLPDAPRGADLTAAVAQRLADVGLSAADATRYPHEFSGGQRQRIAIARALASAPKLIVADEAVSALDMTVRAQILRLLLDLRDCRGVSILFISHDIAVVDEIADRIGVMYDGRLVEIGDKRDVLERPAHAYTGRLLAAELTLDHIGRRHRGRLPLLSSRDASA